MHERYDLIRTVKLHSLVRIVSIFAREAFVGFPAKVNIQSSVQVPTVIH